MFHEKEVKQSTDKKWNWINLNRGRHGNFYTAKKTHTPYPELNVKKKIKIYFWKDQYILYGELFFFVWDFFVANYFYINTCYGSQDNVEEEGEVKEKNKNIKRHLDSKELR